MEHMGYVMSKKQSRVNAGTGIAERDRGQIKWDDRWMLRMCACVTGRSDVNIILEGRSGEVVCNILVRTAPMTRTIRSQAQQGST